MARIEKTVFISYRRKDISWALAVYQYLTSQKYDVFFDFSSLSSGDFEQVIVSNIKARAHFVLILTPTALDRCSEPGDWLRREIETAIDEKRNIIPLFFDEFSFGRPSVAGKLTGKLSAIKRYNGLDIPSGYFLEAMERLSERYLNVPLDAVIQPVSTEVRKVVKEEQVAVNEALVQRWEDIKDLFKPAKEKTGIASSGQGKGKTFNPRLYGIGAGILLIAVLGIFGIRLIIQGSSEKETSTATGLASLISTSTITGVTPTYTQLVSTSMVTPVPVTSTPAATPTLGVGSAMISPVDSMTLLYVPGGEFTMGSDLAQNEGPPHNVTLQSFWIDKTEITNAMYVKCVEDNQCDPPDSKNSNSRGNYYGKSEFNSYPVIFISWNDAKAYCTWVGRRLPTEAEWEKAASWKDSTKEKYLYPWGNASPNNDLLNFNNALRDTTEVGYYPDGASPYGALDMAGNVWEWVNDWYDENYYGNSKSTDPQGPLSGQSKVLRGGSWKETYYYVRSSRRIWDSPTSTHSYMGFRCAMSVSK